MIRPVPLLFAVACHGPASGTFVGNPTMTARLADNPVQRADGGVLHTLGIHFTETVDDETALGPTTFTFDGPDALETIDVPAGRHGGVFLVVDDFEVRFEEDGELTTILADDFDIFLPAAFAAVDRGAYLLRFGDEAWLAELAALSDPGVIRLDGSDPALEDAFYQGMLAGSEVLNVTSGG